MKIILGSKSPRRQALVKELGYPVEIRIKEVEEIYPEELKPEEVPEYLAKLKAEALKDDLKKDELLITSDTIVILNGNVLGKPKNKSEASAMLNSLSNSMHKVITGVALSTNETQKSFSTTTEVYFSELNEQDINFYIEKYKPFDKAGSYGIQEWIGYIGVKKINGCYYNVMGLPLHDLNQAIKSLK